MPLVSGLGISGRNYKMIGWLLPVLGLEVLAGGDVNQGWLSLVLGLGPFGGYHNRS